jgi:hypothetical protein
LYRKCIDISSISRNGEHIDCCQRCLTLWTLVGCYRRFGATYAYDGVIRSSETFVSTHMTKIKNKAVPILAMVALVGERRYSSYLFLISVLDEGEWSASSPGRPLPGERTPGTHCTGGCVGLRAGLNTEVRGKILCPSRGSNPMARSSSP